MRRNAILAGVGLVIASVGCTPDWARQGDSPVTLLITGINEGTVLDSDVAISTGSVCPDLITVRVENHFKNPNQGATGFRQDIVVDRYEIRYRRSDGRNVEGVDVPFSISGAIAQEVQETNAAEVKLEAVRRQAKLEPPLKNLTNGGAIVFSAIAEVTLFAHDNTGHRTNSASANIQIDFANFGDTLTACAAQ